MKEKVSLPATSSFESEYTHGPRPPPCRLPTVKQTFEKLKMIFFFSFLLGPCLGQFWVLGVSSDSRAGAGDIPGVCGVRTLRVARVQVQGGTSDLGVPSIPLYLGFALHARALLGRPVYSYCIL